MEWFACKICTHYSLTLMTNLITWCQFITYINLNKDQPYMKCKEANRKHFIFRSFNILLKYCWTSCS